MEEIKKEEQPVVVEKEYYTKNEVNDLINNKITGVFGDILKKLNETKPIKEEPKKELTIKDLKF